MRLPLATDLSSRDGSVDQDAKTLNCFIEGGEESVVIKRPAVNSVLATASGQAQGSIYNVNSLVYVINGDIVKSYNSSFVLQETITL